MIKNNCENDPLVCICLRVPQSVIIKAVEEGAKTVSELSEKTLAGTGCQACKKTLLYFIAKHTI